MNATTGAVVTGFNNNLTGGIGVNGALTVQALVLSHDDSKLLVVHTGRQIAGQDRYGVGLINTTTNQLSPWQTSLWDDNLQFVGGINRIYAGDISPDDSYFVVTSGSGGDRPPISDTAIAFTLDGGDDMQPLWISRVFDSVYSVAISEVAVYVGGHFNYKESPTLPTRGPVSTTTGYGVVRASAGYGLGDDIVIRDHIGALDPATGKALEWNPGSNSFEGNKAMIVTPRGLVTGGDADDPGRPQRRPHRLLRLQHHPGAGRQRDDDHATRSRVASKTPACRSPSTAPRRRRAASSACRSRSRSRQRPVPAGRPDHVGQPRTRS